MIELELPLPPQGLRPNARVHYFDRARLTKKARSEAYLIARLQAPPKPFRKAIVAPTFYFDKKRDRDNDNLVAWLKPILDGLQDGGIVKNDKDFTVLPPLQVVGKERKLVLQITEEGVESL